MHTATRLAVAAALFFTLVVLPAAAQEMPRYQVFGGYSYWRFDSPSLGFANTSELNGGKISAAFNLTRLFGVVGEVSGGWGPLVRAYDAVIGPQISYPRGRTVFFGQLMFGKAKSRVAIQGEPNGGTSSTGRAFNLAGGVDYEISSHFSIRAVQVDYLSTHTFDKDQSNLRFSAGLVYHFGRVGRHKKEKMPAP